MKIYNLIHEQDTNAAWGCNVTPFLDKPSAQKTMREKWELTVSTWEYDSKEHHDEDTCECAEISAIIRDGEDVETWRIEEYEFDVRVAVRIKGGLVTDVIANVGLNAEVYDLDVSALPDPGEQDEADRKETEFVKLLKSPDWRPVC